MTKNQIMHIKNLDLNYLVLRLVHKLKWKPVDAENAVRKYKNFLILISMHPDINCVPTPEIDEVWHNHILHTRRYADDCNQIFGKYLHHQPSMATAEELALLYEGYTKTMRLYESTFQESYGYTHDITRW